MAERKSASLASGRLYLQRLNMQVRGDSRRAFVFTALQCIGNVAFFTLIGWWLGQSIYAGEMLWEWFAACMLALLVKALLQLATRRATQKLGEAAEYTARQMVFGHWVKPQDGRARQLTEQANLAIEPVTTLYGYFARFRPQLVAAVITPLLILIVVGWLNWIAALLLALAAPLIPLFMVLVGMGAARLNLTHLQTTQKLAGLFVDRAQALTNIRLFNSQAKALSDIQDAGEEVRQANMATLRLAFVSSAVLEFFSAVAIAAVAIFIGFSLLGYYDWELAATLTLTQGLIILLLAPEFFQPMRTLATHYHDRAAALGAAQLLDQLGQSVAETAPPVLSGSSLKLNNLTFNYPSTPVSTPLINHLSFTAKPGQTLLLNGPSGQGKSTLLHILSGQLIGYRGTVSFPGELSHIAFLGQDPFIIVGSVADNLRLVKPDADDAMLQDALDAASLALDLHRPVYEHGAGISGGEKRRLGLARMHLNPSVVMLFDEPTASLDDESALAIINGIRQLQNGQRILVIASHDPRFTTMADLTVSSLQSEPLLSDEPSVRGAFS